MLVRLRPGAWLGPRGVAATIVAALAAAAAAPFVPWPAAVATAALTLVALCLADGLAGARAFSFTRIAPERYALARRDVFRYEVVNRGPVELRFGIVEAPVERLAIALDGVAAAVPPRSRTSVELPFVPRERGRTALGSAYAWYETAYGLVRHRVRLDAPRAIRIMPDLSGLDSGDPALRRRLIDAGLRRLRRRGAGTEFESLREYAAGDPFRSIDWKATARRGRVMVAQHEVERSQQVVVAIDAGRLMSARLGDRRKLDYAVSAGLALAAAGRLAADRVGLHAFAARTLAVIAPGTGPAHAAALADALAELEPQFVESDYERAALELGRAQRKRTLFVVFTDLFDPIASSTLLAALGLLTRHHLVVVALMNDAALAAALAADPHDLGAAYRAAVAAVLNAERKRAIAQLRERGIVVVDAPAEKLSLALIDAYIEIKSRGLL
jgi:uncharacterized protein (DUF58 family)